MTTKQIINKIELGEQSLSFSAISRFMRSPRDFIRYKKRKTKPTAAMLEGQYAHLRLFNPCSASLEYRTGKATSKDDKRIKLTPANYRNALQYVYNVRAHSKYKQLRSTARRVETTETIHLEQFSFRRVIDLDCYDAIYDVKTMGAADLSPRKFKYKVYDFNYHVQAAIYVAQYDSIQENIQNIDTLPSFHWIAVTKTDCIILECHKDLIIAGFHKLQQAFEDWQRCIATDSWNQGMEFYLNNDNLVIKP